MKAICDTNVVSQYIGSYQPAIERVVDDEIGIDDICITEVIQMEFNRWLSVYKGFTKAQRMACKQLINQFTIFHINEEVSKLSLKISNKWDNLEPADILIGATAIYYELPFYTCNVKHFRPMVAFGLDLRPITLP